jgi:polyferredoxin
MSLTAYLNHLAHIIVTHRDHALIAVVALGFFAAGMQMKRMFTNSNGYPSAASRAHQRNILVWTILFSSFFAAAGIIPAVALFPVLAVMVIVWSTHMFHGGFGMLSAIAIFTIFFAAGYS